MKPNNLSSNDQTANANSCYPTAYNNFSNDIYCLNSNAQTPNQFLNYSNYHHHHHHQQQQYYDENYLPYALESTNFAQSHEHQENVATMQQNNNNHNNDLYEFLPEEIFQLDQPIVKNEPIMQNHSVPITSSTAAYDSNIIIPSTYGEPIAQNYNLDLCQSELNHNGGSNASLVKYSNAPNNYSEINNNLNYNVSSTHNQNVNSMSSNYIAPQESSSSSVRFAYETEKIRKHSASSSSTTALSTYPQNPQSSSSVTVNSKRDNFYIFQQSPNYYLPEIYSASPSSKNSTNDVMMYHRSINNYVVNN